ncbi:MAG: uroporphyrinogen-III synthase [Alistipes sp.]|jgi:uroporphyrinogen-III synthase|nr:uroporphyrinogen-III synthase [Alistipes sp.]
MSQNIEKILVAQPAPPIVEKSPFYELSNRLGLQVDYNPLIKVIGVTPKEFRSQRVNILDHTAVIFTSRTTIDSFFHICEDARVTVPETMKYICSTESIALYLQKYIIYRKRKISFADGSFTGLIELVVKHKAEKMLLALSEPHKPEIPEALTRLNINYTPIILAKTVTTDISAEKLKEYDMILLYSPWDVKSICEKMPIEEIPLVATFGEGTLKSAVEHNIHVRANAPTPAAPSLAKAVDLYIQNVRSGKAISDVEFVSDESKEEFLRSQQSRLSKRGRVRKSTK